MRGAALRVMMSENRNILIILCDQLRADFLSVYGGPRITPNIERLAESAAIFDKAYTVSPICVPARMTLLTGMHPLTCPDTIPPEVPTFPGILAQAGYHTAAFGKMHMIPPRGPYGFKELVLSEDTGVNMFLDDYHPWCSRHNVVEWSHGLDNWDFLPVENSLAEKWTVTHWNGDQAVAFLKRQGSSSVPFMGVVSFVKPHPPYDPPLPWSRTITPEQAPPVVGLERPLSDYPEGVRVLADCMRYAELEKLGVAPEMRACYLGLVAQIDNQIGRILDTLEQEGLMEHTLILFSSDHGDFLGDHHLFMKLFPYEASSRIPLIVRGNGIQSGRYDIPVSLLDFVPTLLDYAGVKPETSCQGQSILSLLQSKGAGRTGVLTSYSNSVLSWSGREYKFIRWITGEEELFNVANDPNETHNVIKTEPDVYAEMRQELLNELKRLDDQRTGGLPSILKDGEFIADAPDFNKRYEHVRKRYMHLHKIR